MSAVSPSNVTQCHIFQTNAALIFRFQAKNSTKKRQTNFERIEIEKKKINVFLPQWTSRTGSGCRRFRCCRCCRTASMFCFACHFSMNLTIFSKFPDKISTHKLVLCLQKWVLLFQLKKFTQKYCWLFFDRSEMKWDVFFLPQARRDALVWMYETITNGSHAKRFRNYESNITHTA